MVSLNTRQRDLLQVLLNSDTTLGAAELAAEMHLTPRQVNYGLKGLGSWLQARDISLKVTPGVGVELSCTPERARRLLRELDAADAVQLVLTLEQRRQLLAFSLLNAQEPLILYHLQQLTEVSRTTILKDLDALESWYAQHHLSLNRKPNYGIWVDGPELARRQCLIAWVYGQQPLGEPLTTISHSKGLQFSLGDDAGLLPIVKKTMSIIAEWDLRRMLTQVAYAEAQLGGRFTDDAVLFLALSFAIQGSRAGREQTISVDKTTLLWLEELPVWAAATQIAGRLGWQHGTVWPKEEVAGLAMAILAAPKNERWPGDLHVDETFPLLVDAILESIAGGYEMPELSRDHTLRDGIITHLIPALLRHRFNLWAPPPSSEITLSEEYDLEHDLAQDLAIMIQKHTGISVSHNELNDLKLLMRAAYIRRRPIQAHEVWVVCPSGMATAQLLIVRLQARFPRLTNLKVISLRALNPAIAASAALILTTVPLPEQVTRGANVLQVHPMLLPEDIEAITKWLAWQSPPG